MYYKFNTDDAERAKAALILYAIYRSRNASSSLNGLETWSRFATYIRGACLKSINTAEFIDNFCKMADVGSIKPKYLKCDDDLTMLSSGCIVQSDDVNDYKIEIFEDDSLFDLFEREGMLLTMLVRDRIEREKVEAINYEDEN